MCLIDLCLALVPRKMGFGSYESKHSLTAIVCTILRFVGIETSVGGVPSLILIIFPLPLSKMVDFIVHWATQVVGQFMQRMCG